MQCQRCNSTLLPDESTCPNCGYDYTEKQTPSVALRQRQKKVDEKLCSDCGARIKALAEICPRCDFRQRCAKTPNDPRNIDSPRFFYDFNTTYGSWKKRKGLAIFFAFFFHGFGIYRFYLGKPAHALLMIAFCWTGIPAVLAWIDGIRLLIMSKDDFENNYTAIEPPPITKYSAIPTLVFLVLLFYWSVGHFDLLPETTSRSSSSSYSRSSGYPSTSARRTCVSHCMQVDLLRDSYGSTESNCIAVCSVVKDRIR